MTDDEIERTAIGCGMRIGVRAWETGSKKFRQAFARSIIAQARAQLEAELKPVGYMDSTAHRLLAMKQHVAIFPNNKDGRKVALAIIPNTKEGHEDQ